MGSKGSEIVERIDQYAQEKGLTRPDIYKKVEISANSFSNWAKRDTVPPADIALSIADLLGVSIRLLVTGKEEKEYSRDEQNLISKYRCLDTQGQFEVKTLIDAKLTVLPESDEGKKAASV